MPKGSYEKSIQRFNKIAEDYFKALSVGTSIDTAMDTAIRKNFSFPQILNERVKAISPLPEKYSKEALTLALQNPFQNEKFLGNATEYIRWASYPFFKIIKTYADIPTYHNYVSPCYVEKEETETKEFKREAILTEKIRKSINPENVAHKITGQALLQGKVFYYVRAKIDKTHNQVNYAFLQQLPTEYCKIIGFNNVSGYSVAFNMMYFLEPGTDYRQFGDLFLPYIEDFDNSFEKENGKVRYNLSKVNANGYGNPEAYRIDGHNYYYVTLPIEDVWTFEIDDTTAAAISPFASLIDTYAQQSEYEATELALLLNPLIKIFTGEIPYFDDDNSGIEDRYKLSTGGRKLFEVLFEKLMQEHKTDGVAFYSAPVQNIKSHDFSESENANDVSISYNKYIGTKSGTSTIIPNTDDVKASQIQGAEMLESRYANKIYVQFERMMNYLFSRLNLRYEWKFKMFGSIYIDKTIRENAKAMLDIGDTSAMYILSALDGNSWIDKLSQMRAINSSGIMDELKVPQTAYTQSGTAGRPESDEMSDSKEHSIDSMGDTTE